MSQLRTAYTLYSLTTGELGAVMFHNDATIAAFTAGNNEIGFYPGRHNSMTHYIDVTYELHTLTPRPVMSVIFDKLTMIAGGPTGDFIILTGVPTDASVYIGDIGTSIADGTDIKLTFVDARMYTITIQLFPYQIFQESINAN